MKRTNLTTLTIQEMAMAWEAIQHPSFQGLAILNADYSFRYTNPQFCEILGVTPAEILGKKLTEMLSINTRALTAKNGQMLKDGLMHCFILEQELELGLGNSQNVTMIITRAPHSLVEPFEFFLIAMMDAPQLDASMATPGSNTENPSTLDKVVKFTIKYGRLIITLGLTIGAAMAGFIIAITQYLEGNV